MSNRRFAALLALLLAVPLGACGQSGEQEGNTDPAAEPGAMDGLTPDQIRQRADAMSPEQAESLGIVDTTIHMESLAPDSVLIPPSDTAGNPRAQ